MTDHLTVEGTLWLAKEGTPFGNVQHLKLLSEIHKTGSITKAAKEVGISYKTAWEVMNTMNNLSDGLLVERTIGGKGGGGTVLTERGLQLLKNFEVIKTAHDAFLEKLSQSTRGIFEDFKLLQKMSMQTSARNQLLGKVQSITHDGVNSIINMELKGGFVIPVLITQESVRMLNIEVGKTFFLLIKAPNVQCYKYDDTLSLKGSIFDINTSETNVELNISMGDYTVIATMDREIGKAFKKSEIISLKIDPKSVILALPMSS